VHHQQTESIGLLKERLLQFKINYNAVPAGHSLLLELFHQLLLSRTTLIQSITPSNKLLIAIPEEVDAKVEAWNKHSLTLLTIILFSSLPPTHTLEFILVALTTYQKELLSSPATKAFQHTRTLQAQSSLQQLRTLFKKDQSLLVSPLAPPPSNHTLEVSLTLVVVLNSITVSLQSVGVHQSQDLNTCSWRTNGEPIGVLMVSSWSPSTTVVESSKQLLIQLYEKRSSKFIYKIIFQLKKST